MLNFTVGPVQMNEKVCTLGQEQVPYFRTEEFSVLMKENEQMFLKLADAEEDARGVFLTGSGTAAMEAAVMNTITSDDRVLVVNGGSFGQRFVELCEIHEVNYTEIHLDYGRALRKEILKQYENQGYTCFLVNIHETSTGVHYDMNMIQEFCDKNGLFLIVDAISSFLADAISMKKSGIDVLIAGSQKALAVPPGISMIALSEKAVDKVYQTKVKSLYLDLKLALKNGERGQTPFTPAVGILRQIHERLQEITTVGIEKEIQRVHELAEDFRTRIKDLPFEIFSEELSNAVTALKTEGVSAKKVFQILKDEYGIWVCPNGGELQDTIFRVGHIGNLTKDDNTILIQALEDMRVKGILK